MTRVKPADTALRLVRAGQARPQFVCRTCRQHARRRFHTSPVVLADQKPWHERMLNAVFGSRKKQEEEKAREEKDAKKVERLKEEGGAKTTQMTFDGKVYEVAPFIDRALDPKYEKATEWAGLEVIGGDVWAKKQHDKGEPYVGFANVPKKELSPEQLQRLVFLTAFEALALHQKGRSLSQLTNPRTGNCFDVFLKNQVTLQEKLIFLSEEAETAVLNTMKKKQTSAKTPVESELAAETSGMESSEAEPSTSSQLHPEFALDVPFSIPEGTESIRFTDSMLKLHVTKRVYQLTGRRVPDAKLTQVTTLSQLIELFSIQPTPKKLSQHPALQQTIRDMPNVRMASRKTSEKEKEVGRWKLIVEELNKRDLPIRGTRHPGERKYLAGLEKAPPTGVIPPRKRALV